MPKSLLLKIMLPLLLLLMAVGSASWLMAAKATSDKAKIKKAEHAPPTVMVATAKLETLRMDVHSQGVIAPRTEIALVSEVAGKVVKVHPAFAAGGFFKEGELLLAIDPHDYEFAVTRAKAAVAEAYKELLREQEEAHQAADEWQALGSGKATDYVLHKPQVRERQAKLAAARADLDAARLQLERCRLTAPFTGWVRDKSVSTGQYISAGENIARLYADGSAEIRLPIASDQVEFLALPPPGAATQSWPEVTLTVQFGSKRQEWQGHIVRIASDLDDKNAMLYAIADIPDAFKARDGHAPLLPGMFVHAVIAGIERSDLMRLPRSALRGGNQVYSVDSNERLRLHSIDILRSYKDHIIVTEGVTPGDAVLIAGVDLPVDGMRVKIKSTENSPQTAVMPGQDG